MMEDVSTPRDLSTKNPYRQANSITTADRYANARTAAEIKEAMMRATSDRVRMAAASTFVSSHYRAQKVRQKFQHRTHRINLPYELSIIEAKRNRRGMCVGFFQRTPPALGRATPRQFYSAPPPPRH